MGSLPRSLEMVTVTLLLGIQHLESEARNQNWFILCQYIMQLGQGPDILVR